MTQYCGSCSGSLLFQYSNEQSSIVDRDPTIVTLMCVHVCLCSYTSFVSVHKLCKLVLMQFQQDLNLQTCYVSTFPLSYDTDAFDAELCLEIEEFNDFIYEVSFHEWICTSTFMHIFLKSSKEQSYNSKITIHQKHIQCCIWTQLNR